MEKTKSEVKLTYNQLRSLETFAYQLAISSPKARKLIVGALNKNLEEWYSDSCRTQPTAKERLIIKIGK